MTKIEDEWPKEEGFEKIRIAINVALVALGVVIEMVGLNLMSAPSPTISLIGIVAVVGGIAIVAASGMRMFRLLVNKEAP